MDDVPSNIGLLPVLRPATELKKHLFLCLGERFRNRLEGCRVGGCTGGIGDSTGSLRDSVLEAERAPTRVSTALCQRFCMALRVWASPVEAASGRLNRTEWSGIIRPLLPPFRQDQLHNLDCCSDGGFTIEMEVVHPLLRRLVNEPAQIGIQPLSLGETVTTNLNQSSSVILCWRYERSHAGIPPRAKAIKTLPKLVFTNCPPMIIIDTLWTLVPK
jgi:hypothetical protein